MKKASKWTGGWLKSVVSKGKSMFAKASADQSGSSDEDDDLIEIGKSQQTSSTFSRHISSLIGSKIKKDNKYVDSYAKEDLAEPLDDIDILKKALSGQSRQEAPDNNLFSELKFDQLDSLINSKRVPKEETYNYMEFVVVVSFHHQVGSQVEYIYPPIHEDKDE